ncbi:MAG TPA: hypothetical protein VKE51_39260 [Vicinamibacterales bacterium]|nr:hypothetical protein [Vicinamibacterales bacterium]
MAIHGKRPGLHGADGEISARTGVYANVAEIVSESRLHEPARACVQRLAWRRQHLGKVRWRRNVIRKILADARRL